MLKWEEKFIELYIKGKRKEAKILKNIYTPERLYKYQPIDKERLETLENEDLYFSTNKGLNDPFDLSPVYYEEDVVVNYIQSKIPHMNNIPKEEIIIKINEVLEGFSEHSKILSLTTSIDNMPLWAHYGNNHKGMCISYNIENLDRNSDLYEGLFKVVYKDKKIEITEELKNTLDYLLEEDVKEGLLLVFFTFIIKHKSWNYEDEWRVVLESENAESGKIKNPMKVDAIYLGKDCSEDNVKKVIELSNRINCEVYKMEYSKGIDFKLMPIKIK